MKQLTTKQRKVLEFIHESLAISGYPPTRAEIAKHFGFKSANAAEEHLRALHRKGVIEVLPSASRAVRLTAMGYTELGIHDIDQIENRDGKALNLMTLDSTPLIQTLFIKEPLLTRQNIRFGYQLDPNLFTDEIDFFYQLETDAFKHYGLEKNDLLAVRYCDNLHAQDLLLINNHEALSIVRYQQMTANSTQPEILGKIVGLVRNFELTNIETIVQID